MLAAHVDHVDLRHLLELLLVELHLLLLESQPHVRVRALHRELALRLLLLERELLLVPLRGLDLLAKALHGVADALHRAVAPLVLELPRPLDLLLGAEGDVVDGHAESLCCQRAFTAAEKVA